MAQAEEQLLPKDEEALPAKAPPLHENVPPPAAKPETVPQPDPTIGSPPATAAAGPAISHIPPPVPRFSIEGSASAKEGNELRLVIRREGNDGSDHFLEFVYNNGSLLDSPPRYFEFHSKFSDEVSFPLRIAQGTRSDGDHDLTVRLASARGAEVGQPNVLTAVILDRPSPWRELLQWLSSWQAWALFAALAGAASLGLIKFLAPRATCSIDTGQASLGPIPLRSRWPALHVDTAMGRASFSIPHPLPIGGGRDAGTSPA
jgi:hypothetical protein